MTDRSRNGFVLVLVPAGKVDARVAAFRKAYPTFRVSAMPWEITDRDKLANFLWRLHETAMLDRDPTYLFWPSAVNDHRCPRHSWEALQCASEGYAEGGDGVFRCIKYRDGDPQEQQPLLFL